MTSFSSFNPFLQLHRLIRLGRLNPWLLLHGHARALLRTVARLPLLAVLLMLPLMLSLVVTVEAAAAAVLEEEEVVVVVGKRRLSQPSRRRRLSLRRMSSVDSHLPRSTESLQARWASCATLPPAAAGVVVVVVVLAAVVLEELVRVLVLVVLMAVPTTLVKTTARLQGAVGRILAYRSCGSTLCRTVLSHFVSTGGVSQPQPTVAMVVVVVVTLALVHHTMISLAVQR
jgi:hypothetical protein